MLVASGGYGDDLTGARGDFLDVGQRLFVALDGVAVGLVFGGEDDDGEGLVNEGVGAVLHLACRVAFGVDVGNFLELERAFERNGVVDAAAEEEEVAGVGVEAGEGLALGVDGAEDVFDLAGEEVEGFEKVEAFLVGDGTADLGEVEGEEEERDELGGEGLGGGDADFGTGVGVDGAVGLADIMAPTTLQTATVGAPLAIISFCAARVSAVSPDWVMSRPTVLSSTMGSR